MSSLWCHALEPGKPASFLFTSPLVIRNASLGSVCDTKSRTSVQIRYRESGEERATFLCSLVPGKFEQFSLKVTLDAGVHYIGEVIGKNIVYLIGAYTGPDRLPNMSAIAPVAVHSNVHPLPPPGPTMTSQDMTTPHNAHDPSPGPPTRAAVVTVVGKKKTGRSVGSKTIPAPAASRMATRSATAVGTRSKVASTSTFGSSRSVPALPMKDMPIMPISPSQSPLLASMTTIQSLAIEPAPSGRTTGPLSPLKGKLDAIPPVPTDNPTTSIPPVQWVNHLLSLPSEPNKGSYSLASSAFSTSLSNLQATSSKTSSLPDILRVPTPPAHSSPVVHPTSGNTIINSTSTPPQPTYVCVRELRVGSGSQARLQSTVSVRYRGKVGDTKGPVFAENVDGPPFKFCVGDPEVLQGFSDGVIGMAQGGKRTMFIPPAFGFGSKGNDKVPPNSPLVIECEVLGVD